MVRVLGVISKVAPSQSTVLIYGPTGTGKELIAGAVHRCSRRAARAFIRVNCAALQENLLESELFGHEKGAFAGADRQHIGRFEQADGGTLGGMRTLRVDVRFIAATHRDLPAMVQAGWFREDFYYRLNVVPIVMPTRKTGQAMFASSKT
jgi:transcriptional regulator with GAF, ATPase, and Fis domain